MSDLRKQRAALGLSVKVPCAICETLEPLATAHDHHRKPRAFGGTDDEKNRVWLCSSCHTRLHRVQEYLVQGKTASAYDLCNSVFATNVKARGELWTLANEAATVEREVKDGFAAHRTHTMVSLQIDTELWALVKAKAKDEHTSASALATTLLERAAKNL